MDNKIIFTKNEGVVARKIGDQMVLVPIKKGVNDMDNIFSINEVGSRIWDLLNGKRDVGQIFDHLITEYDISENQLKKDIDAYFLELKGSNLITCV